MAVRLDPAGQDQLAGGVDDLRAVEALAEGDDAAARDADVRAEGVGRGGDGAALDDEVHQTDLMAPPSTRIRLPVT